jgi:glutamyl-tRNA reductase
MIRLLVKHTIETAKDVYTKTSIANKPVSVVSLAYRKLKDLNVKLDARFLIIGAGQTNILMSKFLKKHGFTNFAIFNRTFSNAQKLATELNGKAFSLSELSQYKNGFDVILTCTAAAEHIITKEIYSSLLAGETSKKIVIDLSVPNDLDPTLQHNFPICLVDVTTLQSIANENLQERKKELNACHEIICEKVEEFRKALKERKVELAMSEVPRKVKEIRETAINAVFAKEIDALDESSKDVLEKVLAYMEKKYISVPMKMAKDILIEKD